MHSRYFKGNSFYSIFIPTLYEYKITNNCNKDEEEELYIKIKRVPS